MLPTASLVVADTEDEGVIHDLSQHGCRIETPCPIHVGQHYRLILQLSSSSTPLLIANARVCWKSQQQFGLAFEHVDPTQQAQVRATIQQLARLPQK